MNIFSEIRSSVHDPSFYRQVVHERPLSRSIIYFVLFALITALLGSVLFSAMVSPGLTQALREGGESIVEGFPDDLVISIKDGKASTSRTEPYIVPYFVPPAEQKGELVFHNFLVVDTAHQFDVQTFREYSSLVVLNETTIATYDNGNISVTPLSEAPDMALTKKHITSFYGSIEPYLPFVAVIVSILFFFFAFFFTTWKLIYLLFAALLFMSGRRFVPYIALGALSLFALAISTNALLALFAILALTALVIKIQRTIKDMELPYAKAYQIGIHAATLPVLIDGTLSILGLYPRIPLCFTILLAGSVLLNIRTYEGVQRTSS